MLSPCTCLVCIAIAYVRDFGLTHGLANVSLIDPPCVHIVYTYDVTGQTARGETGVERAVPVVATATCYFVTRGLPAAEGKSKETSATERRRAKDRRGTIIF